MARKPNYQFERSERERAKAAKTAEKNAARQRARDEGAAPDDAGAKPPEASR